MTLCCFFFCPVPYGFKQWWEKKKCHTSKETGEVKRISVLIDHEGKTYTSISATIDDIMDDVIELLDEGEPVSLRLLKRTSSNGREFLSFQVM